MEAYLGVDVGSVTTKFALVAGSGEVIACNYLRTRGEPVAAVQQGLEDIEKRLPAGGRVRGVCTTGSARYLAGVVLGADLVKNEITAQAMGAVHFVPDVRTVLEIGGQDSKLIILRDGMVVDFGMNTVCAAGTGSFLDQQASRLGMSIEDFGELALRSRHPVRIDGRCTVFAESDMIHRQQMGHAAADIVYGLCLALVRNYLNGVGLGKELLAPISFQGGVAFNRGMVRALEESLDTPLVVPPRREALGAIGAALLARDHVSRAGLETAFSGFEVIDAQYQTSSFGCEACAEHCEIAQVIRNDRVVACWGGRCNLWEETRSAQERRGA
jgi:predicted CoA-substrate-specific enzyme activase